MSETNTPGEKKLSVGSKTLSLKPRTETGVVRQSFSHGRSKQVVVEKVKRRAHGPEGKVEAAPAPAPTAARTDRQSGGSRSATAPRSARRRTRTGRDLAAKPSGVVLRTLTDEERNRRAHALGDARLREAEERKIAEEEAERRTTRDKFERAEREAAESRKRDEDDRRKHEEETKRKAERGREEALRRRSHGSGRPPARRTHGARGRGRRRTAHIPSRCRRRRPSRTAAKGCAHPRGGQTARPSDARNRAHRRRGARALPGVLHPPHQTPDEGTRRSTSRRKRSSAKSPFPNSSPSRNSPTAWPSARWTSSSC